MADISKVTFNSNEYDIKDTVARNQMVQLTAAEYEEIPDSVKNSDNKLYLVEDGPMGTIYRNGVPFIGGGGGGTVDTVNGISPDSDKNVQVDVELTQSEYDALPASKLTDDVNYFITDGSPTVPNVFDAKGVMYDNTSSGLTASDVQDAVDENAGAIKTLNRDLFDLVYPVGSIYMSVNSVNPSTLFGGTWEAWGSGRVPVGINTNDSNFDTVEKTGGASSVTLTASQSGVPAHAHGLNSHTHSVGAHSHGLNSHKHSVGAHSHGLNSHKHSVGAHAHGLNSHTHSIPALSGSTNKTGAHTHNMPFTNTSGTLGTNWYIKADYNKGVWSSTTTSNGDHQHTVTTVANTTGKASGNTANSTAFDTGAASGSTANSAAFDTGAASGSTANSTAFDTGAASGNTSNNTAANASEAHTNLQPYITCYMWKRTA